MKKIIKLSKVQLKLIYWGLVTLGFICLILPILFFMSFFNPNKLQNLINTRLINTGYSIKIAGKVNPYIWDGLNIELNNVDVYQDKHLLMHFKYIQSQLSWLKLIVGEAVISHLLVNGIEFDSTKNSWADIVTSLQNKQFNSIFNTNNTIDLLHINNFKNMTQLSKFKDASIHLTNKDATHNLILKFTIPTYNLTVLTSALVNVEHNILSFNNIKTNIITKRLLIQLNSRGNYNLLQRSLSLSNLSGYLNYNNSKGILHAEELAIDKDGVIKLINAHYITDLDASNTSKLRSLSIDANQIMSINKYQFKSSLVNLRYSSELDSINSIHTLSTLTSLNLDIESGKITSFCNNVLQVNNSSDMMQPYTALLNGKCNYDYKQESFTVNLSGQLNDSAIQLKANYLNTDTPNLYLNAKINNLTMNQKLINKLPNKLDLFHNNELLPFNNLFNLKLNAEIYINKLSLGDTAFNNFSTKVNINESQVDISSLQANYHQGNLALKAKINKSANKLFNISLWQKFTNIDLNNFFDDFFNVQAFSGGQSTIELNAQMPQVATYNDLVRKFNGTVNISAKNGSFQGLNINSLLASNPNKSSLVAMNSTLFTHLTSTWQFKNGVSDVNSLNFYSAYYFANGSGLINLVESNINYKLNVHSNLPANDDKIKSVQIAMNVHGHLFNPEVYIESIQFYKLQPPQIKLKKPSHKSTKKAKSHKKLTSHIYAKKIIHIRRKVVIKRKK